MAVGVRGSIVLSGGLIFLAAFVRITLQLEGGIAQRFGRGPKS